MNPDKFLRNLTWSLLLIFVLGTLCACANKNNCKDYHTASYGFENEQCTSDGVESSIVAYDGSLKMLVDPNMDGTLASGELSDNVLKDVKFESMDRRFSYVFGKDGTYYLFATISGSIYAWTSQDLVSWKELNNGKSVLDPKPNSVTSQLWNVGVDIDDNSTFHLFAESTDTDNAHACLTYFSASLDGNTLDFNPSRPSTCLVKYSGNPFVKFVSGKGLLLVYGDQADGGVWKTSAGIVDLDGNFKKSKSFSIGYNNVHICDPTMEELNGVLYLAVSVDQDSIHTMQKSGTFIEFFNEIEKEL